MNKVDILLIISLLGLIFAVLSTIIGLTALVKVIAAEKSTHTLTYQPVPVDQEIEKANEEVLKKWARDSQSTIAKDQELFKEDLETEFPDFLDTDESDGAISF